jgi:hypothetical protein
MSKPIPSPVLPSSPIHHRSNISLAPCTTPLHSSQLAKKARNRAPAVAAAQNVLMRKLCISTEPQLKAANFEKFINLFNDSLSKAQVWLIQDLFWVKTPEYVEGTVNQDEE